MTEFLTFILGIIAGVWTCFNWSFLKKKICKGVNNGNKNKQHTGNTAIGKRNKG